MDVEKDNGKMLVPAGIAIIIASWLSAVLADNFIRRPSQVGKIHSKSQKGFKSLKWSLAINSKNISSTLIIKVRRFSNIRSKFLRSQFI